MAVISGYASLKTAIGDFLSRSDLTLFTDNFIQNWEERFYRQPKNFGRWMETSLSTAISSSVIAVPAAYLGLKYAYINGSPSSRLDRLSLNQLYGRYPRGDQTGLPVAISRDVSNFVFGPAPDSNYTVKGVYWAKPTLIRSFAADAAAHWLIVNAPDLVLYGSLLQAEPFIKNDARVPLWRDMYNDALKDYRDLHRDEDQSGSPSQEVLA
jgi:hypothetical protein